MVSLKQPTKSSPCISVALQEIDLKSGFVGYHGQNISIIHHIRSSLKETPFKVVYGRDPPTLRPYEAGTSPLPAVDQMITERDQFFAEIRDRLVFAQQQHKRHYDMKHREICFEVGQWAWLRLQHRQAATMVDTLNKKLAPRFYGPYEVTEKIGDVAYRLKLPARARIHDVFHVSMLKPYQGAPPSSPPALPELHHGRVIPSPRQVLKARLSRGIREVLVQWAGLPDSDASWKPLVQFKEQFPSFQLEDELLAEEGRDVMVGLHYKRRVRPASAGIN
jgi:hypothetical protein